MSNVELYRRTYNGSQYWKVTQKFGNIGPIDGKPHNGEDTANHTAGTKMTIYAVANGEVIFAGKDGYSGALFVEVLYKDGIVLSYWHLSKYDVVMGQKVSKGQLLGTTGDSGFSTGIHLHLSIYHISNRTGIWQRGLDAFYDPATFDVTKLDEPKPKPKPKPEPKPEPAPTPTPTPTPVEPFNPFKGYTLKWMTEPYSSDDPTKYPYIEVRATRELNSLSIMQQHFDVDPGSDLANPWKWLYFFNVRMGKLKDNVRLEEQQVVVVPIADRNLGKFE